MKKLIGIIILCFTIIGFLLIKLNYKNIEIKNMKINNIEELKLKKTKEMINNIEIREMRKRKEILTIKQVKQLRKGCTSKEVSQILGYDFPIQSLFLPPRESNYSNFFTGQIQLCSLFYNRETQKFGIPRYDMFSGPKFYHLPEPTKIEIILPENNVTFKLRDFPNSLCFGKYVWIDVRWFYPQGNYPMKYKITLNKEKNVFKADFSETNQPHTCFRLNTPGNYSFKIRAENDAGEGEWSDEIFFTVVE